MAVKIQHIFSLVGVRLSGMAWQAWSRAHVCGARHGERSAAKRASGRREEKREDGLLRDVVRAGGWPAWRCGGAGK